MKKLIFIFLLALGGPLSAVADSSYVIKIDGMTCKFCAHNVKKHLKKLDGVEEVKVDQDKGLASLTVIPGTQLTDAKLKAVIAKAGYNYRGIQTRPE
ncbi:MAG: heavy-metal-associated domain-containing protein [Gammaproteobacteria bacterium]|nr:heavy-metal-associated domain-containing protein [Gammaproteobacteria bacterium]